MVFATPGFNDIKINLENIPLTGAVVGQQRLSLRLQQKTGKKQLAVTVLKTLKTTGCKKKM